MGECVTPVVVMERYFLAAEKGDVKGIEDSLENSSESGLDINCIDASGRSALQVAIEHGNLGESMFAQVINA